MPYIVYNVYDSGPLTEAAGAGGSGDIDSMGQSKLAISIDVTAVTNGITFSLLRKGLDGIYYTVKSWTKITSAGEIVDSVGPGLNIAHLAGGIFQLAWVVDASGSATFTASIEGMQ